MAGLTDLSNELLVIIASFLAARKDSLALSKLCLTSHRLLAIAQPALYSSVRLSNPPEEPLRPMKSFLLTVLSQPELAKATQELSFINDNHLHYEWPIRLDESYAIGLFAAISKADYDATSRNDRSPLVVALLSRLPNLKHICYTAEVPLPYILLNATFEMQEEIGILSRLESFHLNKRFEDGPVDIFPYIDLWRCPSFKNFSTANNVPNFDNGCPATNIITPSSMQLFWWMGPLFKIAGLFAICTALKTFELVIPDGKRYRSSEEIDFDPLVAPRELVAFLLEAHGSTLESIRLDFHHFYSLRDLEIIEEIEESGQNMETCDYTYMSFRESETLKHIHIEFEKLVVLRHLPASLVSLILDHCHFPDLDHDYLNQLLRLKEAWCPAIESVTVRGWEWTMEDTDAMLEYAWPLKAHIVVGEKETTFSFSNIGYQLQIQFRRAFHSELPEHHLEPSRRDSTWVDSDDDWL